MANRCLAAAHSSACFAPIFISRHSTFRGRVPGLRREIGRYTYLMLSNRLLGLAVLLSASALADVIPLTSLNLVQSAPGTTSLINGNTVLRLTPNFETNPGSPVSPAGAAWTSSTQDVADPFSLQFHFRMSDPCLAGLPTCVDDHGHGGDGIAFVIQNSAQGKSALGVGA